MAEKKLKSWTWNFSEFVIAIILGKSMPFETLFADKKVMSSGLQLADPVARPIGMDFLQSGQGNRAFDVLKNKFLCEKRSRAQIN